MLFKIIGVGLCSVVISVILKQYKPEFALLINVCCGVIIFLMLIDGVKTIINSMVEIQTLSEFKVDILSPILKVVGIGYITEWSSDLAEESGNKSISNKIILGGKVSICIVALPLIKNLISAILSLI